jgi:Enolase C-terminal domain-like
MPEHRVDAYVRLAEELTIPICSPEIAEGGIHTRAQWILRHASDISRIDVLRGGTTGAMKMAATCDAFGIRCELHMSGFGNLQVLGATAAPKVRGNYVNWGRSRARGDASSDLDGQRHVVGSRTAVTPVGHDAARIVEPLAAGTRIRFDDPGRAGRRSCTGHSLPRTPPRIPGRFRFCARPVQGVVVNGVARACVTRLETGQRCRHGPCGPPRAHRRRALRRVEGGAPSGTRDQRTAWPAAAPGWAGTTWACRAT